MEGLPTRCMCVEGGREEPHNTWMERSACCMDAQIKLAGQRCMVALFTETTPGAVWKGVGHRLPGWRWIWQRMLHG